MDDFLIWTIACVVCLILTKYVFDQRRQVRLTTIGKTVFISGCDTGIGHRLALYCHQQGLTVFAGCLNVDGEGATVLRAAGSERLHVVPLDVTVDDSVQSAVTFVNDHLPPGEKGVWCLINNAGVCVFGEFDWLTWRQCQTQVDVNLLGTIRLTKAFLRSIRQREGRILTITSVNGQCAYPGIAVYSATKFALEGFFDALRREMVKFGVRVVILQPGDFARLTSIMSEHQRHAQLMWDNMADQERSLYGDYFQTYHHQVLANHGITSPPDFQSSTLLGDVRDAVLSPVPRARYTSAPFAMKVFLFLSRLLPTLWTDAIIVWLFQRVFKAKLPSM